MTTTNTPAPAGDDGLPEPVAYRCWHPKASHCFCLSSEPPGQRRTDTGGQDEYFGGKVDALYTADQMRAAIAAKEAELSTLRESHKGCCQTLERVRGQLTESREHLAETGRDAANYGEALNEAAWAFVESYNKHTGEHPSGVLFNNTKSILREAILTYLAAIATNVAAANPAPTQGGV